MGQNIDTASLGPQVKPISSHHHDAWLAGIVVLVAALCVVAVYVFHTLVHKPANLPPELVSYQIGSRKMTLPGQWLRASTSGKALPVSGSQLEQLDLVINADQITGLSTGLSGAQAGITITVTAADNTMAPELRASQLYARFMTGGATATSSGLIRREFYKGSPFENDVFLMEAPYGQRFTARCPLSANQVSGNQGPVYCQTDFRWNGLDFRMMYAEELLGHWNEMRRGVRTMFGAPD